MRISTVIELFLILLLVAFAAYGRVIDRDEIHRRAVRAVDGSKQTVLNLPSLKQATDTVNRYCTCNENICNCCRDFHIPLVQLKGPGCASLQYLHGDNLALQLSFGESILTSTIVNGKNPKPVCVPLPGGFTKFCGRVYSIQRDAKDHFKACLGLELQSATELEASLRVSCFRFGPEGLKLRPAEPLPVIETEASDEDDDEDDFFGLGGDDDDDDDEDEEADAPVANAASDPAVDDDDDDDDDVLGLGALLDIITGDDETTTKRPKVTTPPPQLDFTIPILTRPTIAEPIEPHDPLTSENIVPIEDSAENEAVVEADNETENVEEQNDADVLDNPIEDTEAAESEVEEVEEEAPVITNKIVKINKPNKVGNNKVKGSQVNKKKPSATSINAIQDTDKNKKKPLKKPVKDEEEEDLLTEEDLDDEDDEILEDDDDDDDLGEDEIEDEDEDDEKDDEKLETDLDDEDEKAEDLDDLDDDDEDEDAMLSALVYDEKDEAKKSKPQKNQNSTKHDSDYSMSDLSAFLARKKKGRSARQDKVTRH